MHSVYVPVAEIERMATGLVVSALPYRATQVDIYYLDAEFTLYLHLTVNQLNGFMILSKYRQKANLQIYKFINSFITKLFTTIHSNIYMV